nr:unnamed protein product [Callosobruchus analis]
MSNSNLNEKRSFLSGEGTKIDKLCYDWFIAARHKGIDSFDRYAYDFF